MFCLLHVDCYLYFYLSNCKALSFNVRTMFLILFLRFFFFETFAWSTFVNTNKKKNNKNLIDVNLLFLIFKLTRFCLLFFFCILLTSCIWRKITLMTLTKNNCYTQLVIFILLLIYMLLQCWWVCFCWLVTIFRTLSNNGYSFYSWLLWMIVICGDDYKIYIYIVVIL